MIDLDRKVDPKAALVEWGGALMAFARKVCTREPKPRHDEPAVSPSNYRYYSAYADKRPPVPFSTNDGASLSGAVQMPCAVEPSKPTIPWFLSGVPEQYHQHYTEWQVKQPSGAPWDFGTYLAATGQMSSYPRFATGIWKPTPKLYNPLDFS